jgi:hypothetical protein
MMTRAGGVMGKLVTVCGLMLAMAGAAVAQGKSQDELRKPFIGSWKLVSITGGTGPAAATRGKPTGIIIYDAHGNMAAQIQPDRKRPTYTGTPTVEQLAERARGYTAYFGTYTIDEKAGTVTHQRQGQLDSGDVNFVRKFEFTDGGNRIVLTPVGGQNPPIQLTWERLR